MSTYEDILNFWFGNSDKETAPLEEKNKLWFEKNETVDKEIKETFIDEIEAALNSLHDDWQDIPEAALALIIILDQFTRNVFRDTPRAFEGDLKALQVALIAIDKGYDKLFHPVKRIFFYLPFEHSENIDMQNKCTELFNQLIEDSPEDLKDKSTGFKDYADKHKVIIEKFGRFPHRNKFLSRESTREEIEFLKEPGSSF